MKALHQMTNTDKGRLLAELFPEQVTHIITAVQNQCIYLKKNEMEVRRVWKSSFIPFMFWLDLAADAQKAIQNYRHNMARSSKVFSEQLFYGHIALFTNDCIVKYAATQTSNPKFQKAVELIFNPDDIIINNQEKTPKTHFMEITDLQGKTIQVTDLEGSIAMVKEFMEYTHEDTDANMQRFDRQRQAYWTDIYDKLLLLKSKMEDGKGNTNPDINQ